MNGYMAAGIGAGIAGAAQEIQKGVLKAYDIKTRRELQDRALQRQARLDAQQEAQFDQASKLRDMQLQQLGLQVKSLTDQLTKKETYDGYSAYRASNGDTKYLNQLLKNPNIAKFTNGVTGFYKLDLNSEQDKKLLEQAGIDEELVKADPTRFVKATRAGNPPGTYDIIDMNGAYARTGYLNVMRDEEVKDLALKSGQLQVKQQEMLIGDAEKWLKEHPDKTYTDYKNLGKTKSTGSVTNASLKEEYTQLKIKEAEGTLTKEEKIKLDTYTQLFNTDNDEKRAILEKGIKIVDKYKDKLFDIEISNDDIIDAKLYSQQAGIKVDTKDNREFKESYNTLKQGKRLAEAVNSLSDEEIARGMLDTGIQKLKTYLADGNKPDDKMLKSIAMQTKLGKFLASYIKSISGTAVAEAEYKRLSDLFGGDNWTNTATLKTAVNSFVDQLDTEFKDRAKTSLLDNPATTLDLVHRYQEEISPSSKEEIVPKDKEEVAPKGKEEVAPKGKEEIIDPNTGKPTGHYVGEVIEYQGKKYKIIDSQGTLEEIK